MRSLVRQTGFVLDVVIDKIARHASGSPDADGGGFADALWAYAHGTAPLRLEAVWGDLVEALQEAQPLLASGGDEGVPLRLAYAVAEILSAAAAAMNTEADDAARTEISLFAWRVACAWEALLAGDIDDLAEHVRLESAARGI